MTNPERFQMPFDFDRRSDPSRIYYELGFLGQENPEGTGRFVRKVREEVVVHTPYAAAQHLLTNVYVPFDAFDQEEMWVCALDTKHRITYEIMVYRGTINSIYIRQAELFKEAIRVNAAALLLSHVHPSGDPTPSPEDIKVTEAAVAAANILGIDLLDHIVIGRDVWVSLKEKGTGFR